VYHYAIDLLNSNLNLERLNKLTAEKKNVEQKLIALYIEGINKGQRPSFIMATNAFLRILVSTSSTTSSRNVAISNEPTSIGMLSPLVTGTHLSVFTITPCQSHEVPAINKKVLEEINRVKYLKQAWAKWPQNAFFCSRAGELSF
jgi:hypothetical protein